MANATQQIKETIDLVDLEAAKAAQLAGAPLLCIGLLLRDQFRQLAWWNRAHRDFAAMLRCASRTEAIAAVGVTAQGCLYTGLNELHAHDWDPQRIVKSFNWDLLVENTPRKSEFSVAKLSRPNLAECVRLGVVKDEKLVSLFSRVPEYVETFYLRTADEGYSATWAEPDVPLSMVN